MSELYVPECQNLNSMVVGVIGGCQFIKHAHLSCHFYRKVPEWAIDMNTLEGFDQEGVQDIFIIDPDINLIYKSTRSDFRDFGVPVPQSRNFLLCLPLKYWSISKWHPP